MTIGKTIDIFSNAEIECLLFQNSIEVMVEKEFGLSWTITGTAIRSTV